MIIMVTSQPRKLLKILYNTLRQKIAQQKMMIYIAITLDVERDWCIGRYSEKPEFSMIKRALPKLFHIADLYGVKYTIFATGEVAEDCTDILGEAIEDGHEVGVHTHPRFHSGIFRGKDVNDRSMDSLMEYPYDQQLAMIEKDTELIRQNFGIKPLSFRAGRLSANHDTLKTINSLGYKVDSSFRISDFYGRMEIIALEKFFPDIQLVEIPIAFWVSRKLFGGAILSKLRFMKRFWELLCYNPARDAIMFTIGFHPMEFGNSMKNYLKQYDWMVSILSRQENVTFTTLAQASLNTDLWSNYSDRTFDSLMKRP